mmetsp:Transcript_28118/g.67181  ORF Transcript_28118/g.67181 Transcript_28118/m.67181 type:complete len:350 (-) Transcript_28118:38-1087(-)
MPPLENEANNLRVYGWEEIKKHDKENDAWVVKDGEVFDVSKFLKEHPGGSSIVLPHLGEDIGDIFVDDDMHAHSKAAHSMMARYRIGTLAGAAVRSQDKGDGANSKLPFIDFSKPIICQVGQLGDRYSEIIHTPQVLDEPARFFEWDFFEFFSRTPWYVVPAVWVPVVFLLLKYASTLGLSSPEIGGTWSAGVLTWTLIEYTLHRHVFHLDELVQFSKWSITTHFLLHGVHHLLPMDPMRLVFPPVLTILFIGPFYFLFRLAFSVPVAVCLLAGGLSGYMSYDLTHYYLHHSAKPPLEYLRSLKTYHLAHHYKNPKLGYGITTKFWDFAFDTVLDESTASGHRTKAKVN